jgi:nicotinate-nucleotide adenylyltransferase
VLLLGADQHATLDSWHEPDRIRRAARIAVAPRTGAPFAATPETIAIAMPPVDVSSTEIRRRVAAGEPIDGLVSPGVARLIGELGLYRG